MNEHTPSQWVQQAQAFAKSGDFSAAVTCLERGSAEHPHNLMLRVNCVAALGQSCQWHKAEAQARAILQVAPEDPGAQFYLGMALLAQGQFEEGWTHYEARWTHLGLDRDAPVTRLWNGETLNGRRLLILCEQGFGDTLQFARYLPRLAEREGLGRQSTPCIAPPQLHALLRTLKGAECFEFIAPDRSGFFPPHDLQVRLMSLARILGTTFTTIPADVPYVSSSPLCVEHWRARLGASEGKLHVGIAWQGRPDFFGEPFRSIPLSVFEPLARLPSVELFSLQIGHGTDQLQRWPRDAPLRVIPDLDQQRGRFTDTAALMGELDLVISSDTVTAHLAGALGCPVWVLLSATPEWRWHAHPTQSPWYPTMRLFRQSALGQWDPVIQQVIDAISDLRGDMPTA